MVLSGLAHSFRRLFSHIRHAALTSCTRGDGARSDMEVLEEERAVHALTRCSSAVLATALPFRGDTERADERGMDRTSMGVLQPTSTVSGISRIGPIKRKLEELEVGAAEFSGSTISLGRPRREAREDASEGMASESRGRERVYAESFNPVEAQSLDEESQLREEDGNSANDADAMWDDDEAGWNNSRDGSSQGNADRTTAYDVMETIEDGTSVSDDKLVSCIREPADHADLSIGKATEELRELEPKGSDDGQSDMSLLRENEFSERDVELENGRTRSQGKETDFEFEFSCRSMGDTGVLEVSSKNGFGFGGSSSKDDSLCDETLGQEGYARCSHTRLQFFVRTYINGRTIVLHSNAFDTIDSVHRQIFLKTGLPISEQRLIYFGRQLQHDQTLAECRVGNDATLYLVARMRSTALPHSWQLINELVATIRRTCAMENQEGHLRLRLMQAQDSIKTGVKEYLTMAMRFVPFSEHMQVFQLAGATSALVMLLLSPIESNRECAEDAIKLFLCSSEECLPAHIHRDCAPVLLDFCKLLAKSAPNHSLYPVCRNALAGLLDTVGVAHGSTYFNEAKADIIVHDFAPFVNELSVRLTSNLRWTAMDYTLKERSAHFTSYVREGQDFTAFVIPLCKAMEACKGIENCSSHLTVSNAEDTANSKENADALSALILCKDEFGGPCVDVVNNDGIGGEIGSQRWLQRLFQGLLKELDNCLEAVIHVTNRPLETAGLLVTEEKPFGWAPYLVVLKGLYAIAKLYERAMVDLLTMLHSRRSALNMLIKQSRWQDDHSWLLEHTLLLDFESKRRLVMAMLPEPQDDHDDRHEFIVHRSQLLSESFEALAYTDPEVLQGGISVEFAGEEATGPGVLREWFSLICREIFNPQNALFLSCPNDHRRKFPNYASRVNPGHLKYFQFCGRVIALALMHRVQMDVVFAVAFFKQLAGLPVSWEDAKDADPVFYESCRKILEMDDDFFDSDVLGLTFVSDEEELGMFKTVELCPGGKEMPVNSKNRQTYIEHMVQRKFVSSVAEQVKSFYQGFSDLLVNANHEQFFRVLEPEDFELMLYGNGQIICLEDWKLHTEYHEYSSSDDQIVWFWQVLEGMTMEQRRKLLFFSTSVTHLPAEGFAGLSSKFHIHKAHTDITWLPTAHTCFYQLILPVYPSFEEMHAKLLAVTDGYIAEGFGFA